MQNIGKVHPARQRIIMEQRVPVEFNHVLHHMSGQKAEQVEDRNILIVIH